MKNTDPRTIPFLFERSVVRYSANVMMWEKSGDRYTGTTYREIHDLVCRFGAGLMSIGIRRGDRIALIAEGQNKWVVAELGILYAGGVNVPLSVKLEELSDLKFRLAHSGARVVIVSSSQLAKVRQIKNDLPEVEKVIVFDEKSFEREEEISFSSILEKGEEFLKSCRREFDERWRSVQESDAANICYTSGTTADPKGIVLSHRNYTANAEQASSILYIPEYYCSLLILPWDHCFAHTAGIYTLMSNGASMASVQVGKTPLEALRNIHVNIKEVRPHFLLSVPAIAKNFRKGIERGIHDKGERIEKLFRRALEVAYVYNGNGWDKGRGASLRSKIEYKLYDRLLFKKVRQSFGGRLEFFVGGGALLDIELQRFFYAIGIPMYQGYGLTEAAPVISANVPQRHKLGSSGSIVPNLLVKICDEKGVELPKCKQGEIVVKGENVMFCYWKNERATRESIRDGWLYTGDLGYMDDDGFLFVLGREKSLLIGHDGEKYSPESIEEAITDNSIYIDQMVLYNDQSLYTIALVVPNKEAVLSKLKESGLSPETDNGQAAALDLLNSEIAQFKQGGKFAGVFPERWLPSAIAVLGEGFTEQNRFLNTTLKMVRGKIAEFYRDHIDYLYTSEGKDILNHQNRMIIKRMA